MSSPNPTVTGARIGGGRDHYQALKPGASQKISFTGTSSQSAFLDGNTKMIRVFPTKDCWIVFGVSPTAAPNDGSSCFLPGGIIQFLVAPGGYKIAVIRDSSNGDLHIVEGATT